MKEKILIVAGTRPEMIKLAPLVLALRQDRAFELRLCITAQHRDLLDPILGLFGIQAHYDLDVMRPGQDLYGVTARVLEGMGNVIRDFCPSTVIVHGDTTTTFAASLAAFYEKAAVGHVEAGLRTGDLYSPWPEEANRRLVSVLTKYHFAPTDGAAENLIREQVPKSRIYVTGNTVIDALLIVLEKIKTNPAIEAMLQAEFEFLDAKKRLILVTAHRRENFGRGMINICHAILDIARHYPDTQIVYPVHPNPNVRKPINELLSGQPNIVLIEPTSYLSFVYLMSRSTLILTDSGGVQEEAPSLGKPVLVLRDTTERPEALEAGTARLVGTDRGEIFAQSKRLLDDPDAYGEMAHAHNPYGDGRAVKCIVSVLKSNKKTDAKALSKTDT